MNTDNDVRVAGPGIRQSMSSLHTWAGLLLGWVLYAMFLTGTVSYFKDELVLMLERAGFADIEVRGQHNDLPPTPADDFLVYLARRPES